LAPGGKRLTVDNTMRSGDAPDRMKFIEATTPIVIGGMERPRRQRGLAVWTVPERVNGNNSAILDGFIGLPTPVSRSTKRGMRQTRPWSAQCGMALGQGVTLAAKLDGVVPRRIAHLRRPAGCPYA
jgi:hypothetical protein